MTPPRSAPTSATQITAAKTTTVATPSTPSVALIAAVAANGIIGAGNRLPWHLSPDLKRFRALTVGHAVIMGRKTWESLPRALPERQNIVVTRRGDYAATGAEIAVSFPDALARVRMAEPAFCIGGGELYRAALPFASTLYMTEIAREFEGDAWFPPYARSDWRESARENHAASSAGDFAYAYVTYERLTPAASTSP